MAIFGAPLASDQASAAYMPPKRNLSQNLSLLADAFHGNHANADRFQLQDNRNYAAWLAQQQRAQAISDWQTKQQWQRDNPAPTPFEQDLRAAGIDPASPQGRQLYQQRVQNQADPIQAIPSHDPTTNQPGLLFMRPSQLRGSQPQHPAIGTVVDQLPGASDAQAGSILNGGAQTGIISPAQAAQIRASLGPNGQAAFQQWMTQNNIRIAQ